MGKVIEVERGNCIEVEKPTGDIVSIELFNCDDDTHVNRVYMYEEDVEDLIKTLQEMIS